MAGLTETRELNGKCVEEETSRRCTESDGTLLSRLPDGLVRAVIWPMMFKKPSPSLLFRLRRVSRCWRDFEGAQLEWQALIFVRLDQPGFFQYLARNDIARPSLTSRLQFEIECLRVLLSEQMENFQFQRRTRVPGYVLLADLPPDWGCAPEYYGI